MPVRLGAGSKAACCNGCRDTKSEVIWNNRQDGRYVSHVLDVKTAVEANAKPVYSVGPDGQWAVTADFARIQRLRPGYGYQGVEDPFVDQRAPKDSGIWRLNLQRRKRSSYRSPIWPPCRMAKSCVLELREPSAHQPWASDLLFLHRWRKTLESGFITRIAITAILGAATTVVPSPSTPRTRGNGRQVWLLDVSDIVAG